MFGERVICGGRGSFDRDDLKEAAGAAVRAMEPESRFWGFGAGWLGFSAAREAERAGFGALEALERVGGWWQRAARPSGSGVAGVWPTGRHTCTLSPEGAGLSHGICYELRAV